MLSYIANIMDWTKWDIETIRSQPFVPMALCLEYASRKYDDKDDEEQTSSNKLDITNPMHLQQMLQG